MHRLHSLQNGKLSHYKRSILVMSLVVRIHFCCYRGYGVNPLLLLFSDPHWHLMWVLLRVSSVGKIDLLENVLYWIWMLETIKVWAKIIIKKQLCLIRIPETIYLSAQSSRAGEYTDSQSAGKYPPIKNEYPEMTLNNLIVGLWGMRSTPLLLSLQGTIYQPLRSGRIWHKVNF